MQIEQGCVVRSISGRDAENFFAVLSVEGNMVTIADGKVRRLESPKRKNLKHLRATGKRLEPGSLTTNKQLRLALRPFGGRQQTAAGMKGR